MDFPFKLHLLSLFLKSYTNISVEFLLGESGFQRLVPLGLLHGGGGWWVGIEPLTFCVQEHPLWLLTPPLLPAGLSRRHRPVCFLSTLLFIWAPDVTRPGLAAVCVSAAAGAPRSHAARMGDKDPIHMGLSADFKAAITTVVRPCCCICYVYFITFTFPQNNNPTKTFEPEVTWTQ